NESVFSTLEKFQAMEQSASPQLRDNWRFQQALYRTYYDAYTRSRLLYETELEGKAMAKLEDAKKSSSAAAMSDAEAILERAVTNPVSTRACHWVETGLVTARSRIASASDIAAAELDFFASSSFAIALPSSSVS